MGSLFAVVLSGNIRYTKTLLLPEMKELVAQSCLILCDPVREP